MSSEIEDGPVPSEEDVVKDTTPPRMSFSNSVPPSKPADASDSAPPTPPKSPRTSFSNSPPLPPKSSPSRAADSSPAFPPKSPPSKVDFSRPQPGQPFHHSNKPSMQRQMSLALQRASRLLPRCRGEVWLYAAAYVAFYTLIMLFRMSTFGFICIMLYTMLITMLVLRYFGHGPLVDQNAFRR